MGRDKALLNYHGKPQREFLFTLLGKYCAKVFTSCRLDQQIPKHLNPLVDKFHFKGPLNGILSAFQDFPNNRWLIVAVDMPHINEATIEKLIRESDQTKLATCFLNLQENLPEPLLTLWEPGAYSLLMKFVKNGNISPREFLKANSILTLEVPDDKILLNVNYPDEVLRVLLP